MWTNAQYDNVTIWWPVWTDVQFENMTIWRSVWQSDNLKVSCEILDMEVRQCEGLCEQMFNIEMSPSGGLWGQMFNMGKRQYEGPWTRNKRLCVIDTMDRSSLPIPYHDLTFYPSHASDSTRPPQRPKCIFPIRSRHHFSFSALPLYLIFMCFFDSWLYVFQLFLGVPSVLWKGHILCIWYHVFRRADTCGWYSSLGCPEKGRFFISGLLFVLNIS